jgi:hypothetical protein
MAKKVIDIIYNLVRKRLTLKGDGKGITSLPRPDQVERGMQTVFKRLKEGGYNPVSADKAIKSEDDLVRVLEDINQRQIARTEAMKKADEGITRVFDKMRRGIPLNPDDQAALQGSGFKTALDNFKGFEPKVIQGGKDLTMKTRIGEIPYIESPTQTIMQGGKRVPVKIPKDAKDDLLKSFDNVMVRGEDTKYDADVLATDLAERRGFIKEGQDATDMDQKDYSKLYSEAYSFLTKSRFLNKPKKAKGGLIKAVKALKKKYGKDIIQKGKAPKDKGGRKKLRQMFKDFEERTKKEGGGLAYMLGEPREEFIFGGGVGLKNLLRSVGKRQGIKGSDVLKQGNPKSQVPKKAKPFVSNRDMADMKRLRIEQLENQLEALKLNRNLLANRDNFPPMFKEVGDDMIRMMLPDEVRQSLKGSTVESLDKEILQIENVLKNLKVGKDKRALNADGGRIGFADGGMSRRTFLKIMAALAAFPVVGKLAKTTKVAKGVKPIVTPTAEMPAHFPKLVEKILKEGQVVKKDFVKKTGDVTTYKHPDRPDIELTIEGEGNRIQLDFDIFDDMESPMRGTRGPNEFNQGEVKYRTAGDGYTKDFEEGIDTGTENLDEFAGMGKQKTSKSKVNLDAYDDLAVPDEDLADGGLAGLLGE